MADGKFVAYYRVSTAQQGHSGLGLDAQREAVMRYLSNGGWPPLAEFTEVETGKGANALDRRPQLQLIARGASAEEVAAIVGALEFGLASAPTPATVVDESSPWLRAALREGVDRGPSCG